MLKYFFVAFLRNLGRHKLQTLVNAASLAIGLAVFGFAFLYVKQQLSFNRGWPDAERIHRLVVEQRGVPGGAEGLSSTVRGSVWNDITGYFADSIDSATRTHNTFLTIRDSGLPLDVNVTFVDPGFSDVFRVDVVAGDIDRALSGPGMLAIEETLAAQIGAEPGKRFMLVGRFDEAVEFEVAAIYRLPPNRSPVLDFRMLTLISDSALPLFGQARAQTSWEGFTPVWLKLKRGIDTAVFNAQQPAFLENAVTAYAPLLGTRPIGEHVFYRWQPLSEVYFNPVGVEAATAGDAVRVASFAAVGLLVLLVGCSNSISLSLASALERRREIGIRKAAGAQRRDIAMQHLAEAVLLTLIALAPAIILLELLLPAFEALMPFTLALEIGAGECLLLGLIAVLVGFGNGIYPAFVLASLRPQQVLKAGADANAGKGQTARGLIVSVQFCFASILLIATAALYLQLAVTRAQPLGFDPANLVFAYFGNGLNLESSDALKTELMKIPGIRSVSNAYSLPHSYAGASIAPTPLVNKEAGGDVVEARTVASDHELFAMLGIPVIAGRGYDPERDSGGGSPQPLVINRAATIALGFSSPEAAVDQVVYRRAADPRFTEVVDNPLRIIGVVEDSLYSHMRRRPSPEAYMLIAPGSGPPSRLVKYDAAIQGIVQERLNEVGQRMFGAPPAVIRFVQPIVDSIFRQDRNESKLLLTSGALALLLACIGLYGLAAFTMERRAKEVGVRKVMGAELGSLMRLFLWKFSRPVLVANLLAWPVAIYFVLQWIERFPYQLDKAWLLPLCLGAMMAVSCIALLTVSVTTIRAATAHPVRALRYE